MKDASIIVVMPNKLPISISSIYELLNGFKDVLEDSRVTFELSNEKTAIIFRNNPEGINLEFRPMGEFGDQKKIFNVSASKLHKSLKHHSKQIADISSGSMVQFVDWTYFLFSITSVIDQHLTFKSEFGSESFPWKDTPVPQTAKPEYSFSLERHQVMRIINFIDREGFNVQLCHSPDKFKIKDLGIDTKMIIDVHNITRESIKMIFNKKILLMTLKTLIQFPTFLSYGFWLEGDSLQIRIGHHMMEVFVRLQSR